MASPKNLTKTSRGSAANNFDNHARNSDDTLMDDDSVDTDRGDNRLGSTGRRRRKSTVDSDKSTKSFETSNQITHAVLSILSFAAFLLSILAAVDKAGSVGTYAYSFFKSALGIGYFLLPIFFLLLCYNFLVGIKRNFKISRVMGTLGLCLSGLGLIDLLPSNNGGFMGHIISTPFLGLFDLYASTILLFACAAVCLLLIFEPLLVSAPGESLWAKIGHFFTRIWNKVLNRENYVDAGNYAIKGYDNTNDDSYSKATPTLQDIKKPEANTVNANNAQKTGGKNGSSLSFSPDEVEAFSADAQAKYRSSYSTKPFVPPPLTLLEKDRGKVEVGDIKANANIIKRTLMNFGIDVEMDEVSVGPSVTRYALKPAEGVKLSRIVALGSDLSLALAAHPIRIEAPIPGKSLVGIEIPNSTKSTVGLASLLNSNDYQGSDKPLLAALGKGVSGRPHFANIAKAPHMLIAGATGSGKSVTIHAIITSLLFRNSPENLKFIMIDPKRVELTLYNKIPHLLTPVITDPKKAILALKWAGKEMSRRYDVLEANATRDIESYHRNILQPAMQKAAKAGSEGADTEAKLPETMPYIAIVLDELADIMQTYPRELEAAIVRLAQMSRAVGIHLILSTQRPSVNVITGLIKANVPTRIALQVASQIDSRTILDNSGAEKLLGAGDMLFQGGDMATPLRLQSAFISESELKRVVDYLHGEYKDEIRSEISFNQNEPGSDAIFASGIGDDASGEDEDDMYEQAKEAVISARKASTSYIQRKLGVGYSRAARLMDMLESRGIIGPANGSKPREILSGAPTAIGIETPATDEPSSPTV